MPHRVFWSVLLGLLLAAGAALCLPSAPASAHGANGERIAAASSHTMLVGATVDLSARQPAETTAWVVTYALAAGLLLIVVALVGLLAAGRPATRYSRHRYRGR